MDFSTNRTITLSSKTLMQQHYNFTALKLRSISGEESLSETYKYLLNLTTSLNMSAYDASNFDLRSMIGHELTVTIQLDGMGSPFLGDASQCNIGAGTRVISGIVTEARLAEQFDRYYLYQITIEPWLVLAKRRTDYKIFQKKSVVEIIDEVLNSQPVYLSWQKRLSHVYPTLTYEVQYGESDYDFIQRLMERYGIYWFFEHSDNVHRMILIDNIAAHDPVISSAYHRLLYSPAENRLDQEFIKHFDVAERLQSGAWTSGDFDFTQPQADLAVQHTLSRISSANNLAIYEWPGNYAELDQGAAYARVRMEEIDSRSWHASGSGNLRNVVCGKVFELTGYPKESANCQYLITRSKLEAKEKGESSESGEYLFKSSFEVQPVKFPWRPTRKTPLPRTTGPQTAIVTGAPGQEIWTDNYGRVKLKFHWDRTSILDHNSSCWVRVSYPWAGSNFGGINIPRVGTEVIVDFENGDPNRPIVTGRVFNALTMPPWELPSNATQSGLISRTLGGDICNANALRFEDRPGLEELWLQAERDMLTEVKNNEIHRVLANRSKAIGGNETTDIDGSRTEKVKQDEIIELMANRSRSVKQDDQVGIGGNQQTKIEGKQRYEVSKDYDRIIGGDDSRDVTGNLSIKVGKNKQSQIQQDMSEKVSGNKSAQIEKNYSITVKDKFELTVGSSSLTMDSEGNISLNGKEINIGSSGSVQIDGKTIDLN